MSEPLPDERPQRRREYSGAGSTLGVAALIVIAVGVAIWWFEVRGGDTPAGIDDGTGVIALDDTLNPTGRAPAAQPGRAAPNFLLRTPEGEPLRLDAFRGSYVLLNFWASWCNPCRGETPELQALAEAAATSAGAKLVVAGVNQQETAGAARAFADQFGVTYPIVLDRSGSVSEAYRVGTGLPVSFLLSPDGVVLKVYPGRVTGQQLQQLRAEYLP
ncbi:MAG: TlpA family protein disulfide reductase [Tepidiformaceae bacterium]